MLSPSVLSRCGARTFAACLTAMCLLALGACETPPPHVARSSQPRGTYEQPKYRYTVAGTGTPDIVSPEWSAMFPGKKIFYYIDLSGDGQHLIKREEPSFDIKLQNSKRAASILLRTIPISPTLRERELRVLMKDIVADIAGGGYEAVQVARDRKTVEEKRFAAEIVSQAAAKLAGDDAYEATIDVANVDQIKLTPTSRQARVEIVLRHTDFKYPIELSSSTKISVPVLFLAVYANLPEDFATDQPVFRDVLARLEIAGKRGFELAASPQSEPAGSDAGR